MDIENLTPEEFNELDIEAKKEFVRQLIHKKAADVKAVLFHPQTGESIDLWKLVDRMGEEEAIEAIVSMMNAAESKAIRLDKCQVDELIGKYKRGECTDEEKQMLKMVLSSMENTDEGYNFQRIFIGDFLNLLSYSQTKLNYNPSIDQISALATIIMMLNLTQLPDNGVSKFKNSDPSSLMSIAEDIGEDIYNTWKASCTSPVDDELVIFGLLHLLSKFTKQTQYPFISAEDIAEKLDIELEDFDEEEEYEEESSEEQFLENIKKAAELKKSIENGSNITKPNVFSPSKEEKDMRNLLKDD